MPARIVGIGQATAGDDGVGIAVVRRLREAAAGPGIELVEAAEPSAMIPYLIDDADPVVLIDAVVGAGRAGRVMRIEGVQSRLKRGRLLSTHGMGVAEAIEMARELKPEAVRRIVVIGVTIARPARYGEGLSAAVAAAVAKAAELALAIARGGAASARDSQRKATLARF